MTYFGVLSGYSPVETTTKRKRPHSEQVTGCIPDTNHYTNVLSLIAYDYIPTYSLSVNV